MFKIGTTSTHVTSSGGYTVPVQKGVSKENTTQVSHKEKDIMTPDDVCEFLGIDAEDLATMIRAYQIPVIRLKKGLHRFSRRQLEGWLDEKATQQKGNDDE